MTSIDWRKTETLGASIYLHAYAGTTLLAETEVSSGSTTFVTFMPTALAGVAMDSLLVTSVPGEDDRKGAFDNIVVNAVPEPASLLLLGTGLTAVAARRRFKQQRT